MIPIMIRQIFESFEYLPRCPRRPSVGAGSLSSFIYSFFDGHLIYLITIIDDDTDDESWLFDDEVKHPPEHYLAEAEELDVQRLRQRRYSPKTQVQLDRVKLQWDQ